MKMRGNKMTINRDSLSLKELRDLGAQVAKAIATFEDRKKQEAIKVLEEKKSPIASVLVISDKMMTTQKNVSLRRLT